MALSDLFGINSTAGNSDIEAAIQALQGVNVPNLASLTLPQLQQYVKAGVLTPQQYQAIQANPEVYSDSIQKTQDNSGSNAQKAALQQLGGIAANGGSTPINEANLRNNINQTNQAMQAARQGIASNAQERGVSGGGLEFISKLMDEQNNSQNANMGAVNAGANNAKLALDALSSQGSLGGQLQGQANQMSQAQAEAAQQIAQYNSQLQSQANQYNTQQANNAQAANLQNAQDISNMNTGNANMRTQYNAQLPQQLFSDQIQKAQGVAGQYGQASNLHQQQATNQNAFLGNILGTGAKLGAAYMTGGASAVPDATNAAIAGTNAYQRNANANNPNLGYAMGGEVKQCYAMGGEVHEHKLCMMAGGETPGDDAPMPGDSPMNDTVDAKLSPGEIVIPRSVAQSPDAPQKAADFVGQTKGQPSMPPMMGDGPSSFADILAKLEENGIELRLSAKGI